MKRRLMRIVLRVILALFALIAAFILSVYTGVWGKLPSTDELSELQYQKATEIYSADSVLIGKFYLYDRQPIGFNEMPSHLVESLIAIEDRRFYQHNGVDYKSLFRVGFKTILLGDASSGGGSTISQQLAKNLYPRNKSGSLTLLVDKLKEMFTAKRIERTFSKDQVIEHYLNTVSFGDNTFGVESASLRFFNKNARELKIEEAAVLIGMLKATYNYNPRLFPQRSLLRRNTVLRALEDIEAISEEEADSLAAIPLVIDYKNYDYNQGIAPYFREEVRKQMETWCNEQRKEGADYNLYTSGLKIYTTLDYKMQQLAEMVMKEHLSALQQEFERSYGKHAPWIKDRALIEKVVKKSEAYQGWLQKGLQAKEAWDSVSVKKTISLTNWDGDFTTQASSIDSITHYMKFLNTGSLGIEPHSGAVKTWIGGIDFEHFKYDHVSQSRRQVGSSFKPIVYTAALDNGIEACSHFSAQEVQYRNLEDWSPSNSNKEDETYLNYSMEEALSKSVNTVSVKILEKTGIPEVIAMARKMGITSSLPELPSLALGTGEIGVEELAGAYASYVNEGRPVVPYLVNSVYSNKGEILYEFANTNVLPQAYSEESRLIMLEMMKSVVNKGTASRIRNRYNLKNDIAGKTGTTQNNKDAWFVAITPRLIHVSWVGLDNHEIGFRDTSMGQGANAALPLFALMMQQMNKDSNFNSITRAKFEQPDPDVLQSLNCEPVVKDNFFKRLFKNPKKKKSRKFKDQKRV